MPGPRAVPVELSAAEREVLEGWSRRRKTGQALALRIVLACAGGGSNAQVAEDLGVTRGTVATWRGRFATGRWEGLADEPRLGAPRKISDVQVEAVIAKTLVEAPPKGTRIGRAGRWRRRPGCRSRRSRGCGGPSASPHLVGTWKLSADPQFVDKVRDVVGLYLNPPEKAIVLCVDEGSQMQAIDRTAPVLPTTPARMTHDYVRHGATSLFAALDRPAARSSPTTTGATASRSSSAS